MINLETTLLCQAKEYERNGWMWFHKMKQTEKKSWTLSVKMKDLSTLEYAADNPVAGVFSENDYIRASSELLYGFLYVIITIEHKCCFSVECGCLSLQMLFLVVNTWTKKRKFIFFYYCLWFYLSIFLEPFPSTLTSTYYHKQQNMRIQGKK